MNSDSVKYDKIPFEDALAETGYGLYNYLMVALAGASGIAFIALAYGSSIIVPTSACELATSGAQQGLQMALPIGGMVLGSLVWGYLGDTRGRRGMLLASLALGAASNAVASISVSWVMLMLIQFLTVILASGIYVLSMTLLSESIPLKNRNVATLLVASVYLIGQGVISGKVTNIKVPFIQGTFNYYLL
ncbi:solute carrier family 22 member 6-A-like [Leguminivora glycinivorella]|uniref:solute carrier family 22 member 6-A-like n=1 Tax=Leguminivora glycinivorella TaxID=1035111 RepID=UPI00200F04CA|nr:solute carrier family 22 member 6-A-like [Leguminivora glycinivorella]